MATTEARSKRGRPPIREAKSQRVLVRVTPEQLQALRTIAAAHGMTVSALVRTRALDTKGLPAPVPAINQSTYILLGRLLNTFNQLTRALYRGRLPLSEAGMLEELLAQLRLARDALIGQGRNRQ